MCALKDAVIQKCNAKFIHKMCNIKKQISWNLKLHMAEMKDVSFGHNAWESGSKCSALLLYTSAL